MARTKKADVLVPEQDATKQEAAEQDTSEQDTAERETVEQDTAEHEAAEQDAAEQEAGTRIPPQYAVTATLGLNLRQGPSLKAPSIAVLPCGVGVFDNGLVQNGWMEVFTGKLTGWVRAEYLEPLWD